MRRPHRLAGCGAFQSFQLRLGGVAIVGRRLLGLGPVPLDATAEDEQREETEEDETAGHYPAADATEEGLFGADVSAMAIGVADLSRRACEKHVEVVGRGENLVCSHDGWQLGGWICGRLGKSKKAMKEDGEEEARKARQPRDDLS